MKARIFGAGSIGNHLSNALRKFDYEVEVIDIDKNALIRMRDEIYPSRYGEWDKNIKLREEPSKDFVDSHSGSGKYDFGLITKTMLEESLLENGKPSEIDKRTDLIAENLWEIFIANGPL